ncbi:DEAD/DEAH box helicase domain-containing protein [Methanobacterium formicicum]|uniref:DEAD/DEAH box helicase domain-containing protein n=1 Tax=Methanobacterium formicicum TaxID=2162 RepID=A0A089ZHS3_METFO|nr:DEAD/DEAH box helicase [Methanobacterium formicicum]AIS31983.1 DEAD/DEAH box helicase domain-containing protein [Methanobacterium formicicum]
MSEIGDNEIERNILEYIETSELSEQKQLFFDTSIQLEDIKNNLFKKESINDEFRLLYEKSIESAIESLIDKRKILTLIKNGRVIGYRSRSSELIRLLYNLKLITRNDEYLDVATLKTAITNKIIPARTENISELKKSIDDFLSKHQNINKVNPADVLVKSLQSTVYKNLSEFQLNSYRNIIDQIKKDPHSVIITASTGAGKTLSFLLAPILYTISAVLRGERGTKAIFVYPRNALADDQYKTIKKLLSTINNQIAQDLDIPFHQPPKITIKKDFGGTRKQEQDNIYNDAPDFIVTNTETLKKRLMYYNTHNSLKTVKFVIFDEIHLYSGMNGTNTIFLIRRLKSILKKYNSVPVFIGASATIAEPKNFGMKLFSLSQKPVHIASDKYETVKSGHVHHVFLKPFSERPALSVAVDATSCIIHNRRDGLIKERNTNLSLNKAKKTICFADSLDTIGSWNNYLSDFEGSKGLKRALSKHTGYARYYKPCSNEEFCNNYVFTDCKEYKSGSCWTLSMDNGKKENLIQHEGKIYRADAIRSNISSSKSKIDDKGEDIFNDPNTPWYFDSIIASPVLEVGVDIDNVKEIILFKAIKSPASYRQKIGRAGREVNSESFCTSIMSNSPIDNYFFRNYSKLISGTLPAVTLSDENLDVTASHLTCAIVEYLASEKIDIYSIGYLSNPEMAIEQAKNKIFLDKNLIRTYLKGITPRNDLIEKAMNNFSFFLDELLQKTMFESIDFTIDGKTPSYISFVSNLSGKNNREYIQKLQQKIDIIEQKITPYITQINDLRRELVEIRNSIGELPPKYRRDVLDFIEIFEKLPSEKIADSILKDFNQLIEDIYKSGRQYADIVSILNSVCKKIPSLDFNEIKNAEDESLNLEDVKKIIANSPKELFFGINLDSVLRLHPSLPHNWLPPETLFESSKTKKVRVYFENRSFTENLDVIFQLLYPGKHSWRYGQPLKVTVDSWPEYGSGEVSLSSHRLKLLDYINSNLLPEDIRSDDKEVPIYIPLSLNSRRIRNDENRLTVPICRTCGRASDGNEYCSHGMGNAYRSANLPRSEPLIHSHVSYEESTSISVPKLPFSEIISNISFSNKINVFKILYGFERYAGGQVFRLYYDKLLGDKYVTDGIIYELEDFHPDIFRNLDKKILRDIRLMQLAKEFYDYLRSNYVSIWDAITILKAMIILYLNKNSVPTDLSDIDRILDISTANKSELSDIITKMYKERDKPVPNRLNELLDDIEKFTLSNFDKFLKHTFMHTLAHYIYISTILLLGVDEKDVGYSFDCEKGSIVIYDAVDGGNGCAKTIQDVKSLLSLDISKNLKDIRNIYSPISPISRDLLSYLEELTIGCASAEADSILLKILDEKFNKIDIAEKNDDTRHQFLNEIQKEWGIDEHDLSHLDGIIKQNLHIPLKNLGDKDDIFIYSFVPEYVAENLSEKDKIKLLPDYDNLDPSESFSRINEIVKDSLTLCVNACNYCLLTHNCNEGFTNSKYTLDKRIIEFILDHIKSPMTVQYNGNLKSTAAEAIPKLKEFEVVYIDGEFTMKSDILKSAYALLGEDIGGKFTKISSFSLYKGRFQVKMELI